MIRLMYTDDVIRKKSLNDWSVVFGDLVMGVCSWANGY